MLKIFKKLKINRAKKLRLKEIKKIHTREWTVLKCLIRRKWIKVKWQNIYNKWYRYIYISNYMGKSLKFRNY